MQQLHFYPTLSTFFFFFFNDTPTTEIYTLSLHDALPISGYLRRLFRPGYNAPSVGGLQLELRNTNTLPAAGRVSVLDRKSTRLNSSHRTISYAVFCLKKKK